MKSQLIACILLHATFIFSLSNAFSILPIQQPQQVAKSGAGTRSKVSVIKAHQHEQQDQNNGEINIYTRNDSRRKFLEIFSLIGTTAVVSPLPGNALVKGNAPPPKKKATEERKCVNVEECQEMAERLATEKDEEMKLNAVPSRLAPGGTRYLDIESVDDSSLALAKAGDVATIHYKVLKLGKRSYDGLSGEGTVVFSRGYGLEDDESKPGQKSFTFTVGDSTVVAALNDALPGMKKGEIRRLAVLPQMGWEKADRSCDGGPGGQGAGGDIKTDYVLVPTATMVATETCFDKSKLPFPERYDQQRRMAQRFDQSLIMEVELVNVKS